MEEGNRKRRHLSSDEWRGVLQRFGVAGMSLGAFCRREGLSASSFRLWRSRLAAVSGDVKSRSPKPPELEGRSADFVDLGALAGGPAQPADRLEIKLDLGAGMTLHIVRG